MAALLLINACHALPMNDLPRNMRLKAFQPHRPDFSCVHQADKLPPASDEAERLFEDGMSATSYTLWWHQRDFPRAAESWTQAAALGHWKASMNLAGLYQLGRGVPRNPEKAVALVEALMRQGVPAAFDRMGTYHAQGLGVNQDIDRAYAFWQLAADMGSPEAQTYLGKRLDAAYDIERFGVWGNRKVALQMLECAFAQAHGAAAYELGLSISVADREYERSLIVLHEGVKLGSADASNRLSVHFNRLSALTNYRIDKDRANRYGFLGDALERNPALRLPNLDKVVPLPPAELPFWDGQRDTLVNAAKAVLSPSPPCPSAPAPSGRTPGSAACR